jgi:hypothetical protein
MHIFNKSENQRVVKAGMIATQKIERNMVCAFERTSSVLNATSQTRDNSLVIRQDNSDKIFEDHQSKDTTTPGKIKCELQSLTIKNRSASL